MPHTIPKNQIQLLMGEIGDPKTSIELVERKKRPTNTRKNTPQSPKPSFSCVLRGTGDEVDDTEILEAAREAGLRVTNCWRIISRRHNSKTNLTRVITSDRDTLESLQKNGISVYGRLYRAEPSRIPEPIPAFCGRCSGIGHSQELCRAPKFICPSCGDDHRHTDCPQKSHPKCPNCGGTEHAAWSTSCPKRRVPVGAGIQAAPIRCAERPNLDADARQSPIGVETLLTTLTTVLVNVLPEIREIIHLAISRAAESIFNRKVTVTYGGSHVHIGVTPKN